MVAYTPRGLRIPFDRQIVPPTTTPAQVVLALLAVAFATAGVVAVLSATAAAEAGTATPDAGTGDGPLASPANGSDDGAANVTVDIGSAPSPIVERQFLVVTARVENPGENAERERVALRIDGERVDSETVRVRGGESREVTLLWESAVGDAGTYTATVSAGNDTESKEVRVFEPPTLSVAVGSATTPVLEGERLNVTATVRNTGDLREERRVALRVDGTTVDATSVRLAAEEATSVTLSWETAAGDAGEYTATVETEDDAAGTNVTVARPATFDVGIESTTAPVGDGALDVTATVENTGGVDGTDSVELHVDGRTVDSQSVTLGPGESRDVTLTWAPGDGDAGEYTATVATADAEAAAAVTVEQPTDDPPRFEVAVESTTGPVTEGEAVEVTALVTNVGDETDTQPITLTADGSERDRRNLTVGPGGTESLTLTWETVQGDAGEYTATVASPGDQAAVDLTVAGTSEDDTATEAGDGDADTTETETDDDSGPLPEASVLFVLVILAGLLASYHRVLRRGTG